MAKVENTFTRPILLKPQRWLLWVSFLRVLPGCLDRASYGFVPLERHGVVLPVASTHFFGEIVSTLQEILGLAAVNSLIIVNS